MYLEEILKIRNKVFSRVVFNTWFRISILVLFGNLFFIRFFILFELDLLRVGYSNLLFNKFFRNFDV